MADQPSYRLKIVETPIYPYFNVPFEVPVFLVDHNDQLKCGLEVILEVRLHFENNTDMALDELLEVGSDTDQLIIEKDGGKKIAVMIKALSMNHGGRKFVVSVSGRAQSGVHISPAFTHAMQSIRYRLVITNKEKVQVEWYKDEGGKENWIKLTVRLFNSNQNFEVERMIRVKLVLLYESGLEVLKQDILRVNNEDRTYINRNGQVSIKFRIEEVSRSHQSQRFKVQVSPDTSEHPLWNDISSDVSNPIEVRSKKNKKVASARHEYDASPTRRPRIESPAEIPDHISVTSTTSEYCNTAVRNSGIDFGVVAESMLRWRDVVMNGMKSIQWKQAGYEVDANGVFEYSKPLYFMTNPLPIITKITEEYHNQSLDTYLTQLANEAERHRGRQATMTQVPEATNQSHRSHSNPSISGEMEERQSQNTVDSTLPVIRNDYIYSSSSNSIGISSTSVSVSRENMTAVRDISTASWGSFQLHPPNQENVEQPSSVILFSGDEDVDNLQFYALARTVLDDSQPNELGREFSGNFPPLLDENLVQFVHATQTWRGFPVYDINRQLIGFYKVEQNNGQPELIFYSISVDEMISKQEITSLTNLLKRDLHSNRDYIFDLNNFENDIDVMKIHVLADFKNLP